MAFGIDEGIQVLRSVATDSPASVWLFLTALAGVLVVAWLGAIDRRRAVLFSLAYLAYAMVVPVVMAAFSRFPMRISLSFFTVAAFGVFSFLASAVADRPAQTELPEGPSRGALALIVISLCMFAWARNLLMWTKREPWPYHPTLQAFADRVNARHGMNMITVGIVEMDPLLADPRGYEVLPNGWGTFTEPWFEYIERFGIHSGHEFLSKMIDNPNAYMIALPYGHETFEEWLRRRLANPRIRMALVDSAEGMPKSLRSELYRLVTTPLVRGSDEWNLLARNEDKDEDLAGPPDVSDRAFVPVALAPPFHRHVLSFGDAAPAPVAEPIDDGLRFMAGGGTAVPCTVLDSESDHAGVELAVTGLGALRFDLTLVNPEHISSVLVTGRTDANHAIRWRWDLSPGAKRFGFSGPVTLVPGYPSHRFAPAGTTGDAADVRELSVVIELDRGSRAGFELRHLEVAAP